MQMGAESSNRDDKATYINVIEKVTGEMGESEDEWMKRGVMIFGLKCRKCVATIVPLQLLLMIACLKMILLRLRQEIEANACCHEGEMCPSHVLSVRDVTIAMAQPRTADRLTKLNDAKQCAARLLNLII
ncbi:hypothetical protein CAPTEDRAFT_194581 [Capitella teleta]|uniref:Uncharacterized protein n=1 Tax=Capitella teleta TaxID=283909 RepID=R7U2A6_CAPTE|nr:hypothetical protein CAPTEDRAFT_194581 [Capitella teleta]|eukprot:ELU00135.1 hypothetical protein CAPTEDRAFT_194581 [Capitella teleta]